jgi:hypothetical protein
VGEVLLIIEPDKNAHGVPSSHIGNGKGNPRKFTPEAPVVMSRKSLCFTSVGVTYISFFCNWSRGIEVISVRQDRFLSGQNCSEDMN